MITISLASDTARHEITFGARKSSLIRSPEYNTLQFLLLAKCLFWCGNKVSIVHCIVTSNPTLHWGKDYRHFFPKIFCQSRHYLLLFTASVCLIKASQAEPLQFTTDRLDRNKRSNRSWFVQNMFMLMNDMNI